VRIQTHLDPENGFTNALKICIGAAFKRFGIDIGKIAQGTGLSLEEINTL